MAPPSLDLRPGERLCAAFKCFFRMLSDGAFARSVVQLAGTPGDSKRPERAHAPALQLLALLQREARLVDFLKEDLAGFSDAEVGAAARVVHAGGKKVLEQYLGLEPILKDSEGARVTIGPGFDSRRIRLTGRVAGDPPYAAVLRHHGWVASSVRFPDVSETLDPTVVAPAEVEL